MKINRKNNPKYADILDDIRHGQCLEFAGRFHSDFKQDDIFMVLRVPVTYWPANEIPDHKVPVVRLLTGQCSFVDRDKKCRRIEAEVHES